MRRMIKLAKPVMGREEIEAVSSVLKSGNLTTKSGDGPYVKRFEELFAKAHNVKYAISVSSGTSALHASLLAADIGPGDEVILPSFTFAATAEAVMLTNAKPVFVDVDIDTCCIDPQAFQNSITKKTKAVIPVHLYGLMANMSEICRIAKENNIVVIEDAAQAHGAELSGKKAGSFGDFGCFSFYGTKSITTGEGGIITTNKRANAEAVASIRNHGEGKIQGVQRLGHNYRLSEIAAAIGCCQIAKLSRILEARRRNAENMTVALETFGKLILPSEPPGYLHAWYVYTLRLRGSRAGERNRLVNRLINSGIETGIYYSTPLHLAPLYRMMYGYKPGSLPKTETLSRQVFSLPVHPNIIDDDIKFIGSRLRKLLT